MGQVPNLSFLPILIIGSGRLAAHLARYFTLEGLNFQTWARKTNTAEDLLQFQKMPYRVLLAVTDSALPVFANMEWHTTSVLIHCSGALTLPNITGFHPLMTFGPKFYGLQTYRNIPIIGEINKPKFVEVFPELKNRAFEIQPEQKGLYHALCVLSGNLTTWIWQRATEELTKKLDLPEDILNLYRQKIFENIQTDLSTALTGPLARRDWKTVQANLDALKDSSLAPLLAAFIHDYVNRHSIASPPLEKEVFL